MNALETTWEIFISRPGLGQDEAYVHETYTDFGTAFSDFARMEVYPDERIELVEVTTHRKTFSARQFGVEQ